jgi:hypothetical protein
MFLQRSFQRKYLFENFVSLSMAKDNKENRETFQTKGYLDAIKNNYLA